MSGLSNFSTHSESRIFLYLLNFDCFVDRRQHLVGILNVPLSKKKETDATVQNVRKCAMRRHWLSNFCGALHRNWMMLATNTSNFCGVLHRNWTMLANNKTSNFCGLLHRNWTHQQKIRGHETAFGYPISQLIPNLECSS